MTDVRRALLVAVSVCAMAACVSVQSTRLGTGVIRPPVTPDHVAIYRTADQVHAQYEEVALLTAAGQYDWTNEEQMYQKMRKEAGALGGNGVILDSITEPSTGAKVASALLGTPAQRPGQAVAIYVRDASASR